MMYSKEQKLNIGAGKRPLKEYINLDSRKLPGIDIVHDLNKYPWPFKDNQFNEVIAMYSLELLEDFIKAIEEIYRISKNKARIIVYSPLFPNMRSAQDPLTRKFMTYNTFDYFTPENRGLNYYSKARFRIIRRKIIFSRNKLLKFLNFLPNISQKFYVRFLFNLFPSNEIIYELETVKLPVIQTDKSF